MSPSCALLEDVPCSVQEVVCAALALLEQLPGTQTSLLEKGRAKIGPVTPADVARMFEALLSGDGGARLFAWEQGPGVISKPLWQQRAFSVTADMLLQVEYSQPLHATLGAVVISYTERRPAFWAKCTHVVHRPGRHERRLCSSLNHGVGWRSAFKERAARRATQPPLSALARCCCASGA